jgi:hypothetical protein
VHDNPRSAVFPAVLITRAIEVQKMIDSTSECQTRPLAEQTLDDFDKFFRSCPGMTFVFLAPGEVNTVYPDVITAIQMLNFRMIDESVHRNLPTKELQND